MYKLNYVILREYRDETPNDSSINHELHNACLIASESDYDRQMELALREAYNGQVTVEEIPDENSEPSQEEDTAAMLVDHEFRLTLLELGLTEV